MVSPSNQSSILLLKKSRFIKDQPQQTTTVSTTGGIKQIFSSIFFTSSFNIYICKILFFIKKIKLKKFTKKIKLNW